MSIPVLRKFRLPFRGYVGLFLALTCFYLLTGSRERPWADATPIYQVAEAMVYRGGFDVPTPWPPSLPRGVDGKIYALAPLFQSVVHVPGVWLRKWGEEKWPKAMHPPAIGLIVPWSSHLAPAMLGALTCLLFLSMCSREGFSRRTSIVATLALGVSTTLWVYSRHGYSEILQAFCAMGMFSQLWAFARHQTAWRAGSVAIWFGLLINAKPLFGLILPGLGAFVVWLLWKNWRRLIVYTAAFGLVMLPFAGAILWYNSVRFGAGTSSGYGIAARVFAENPILGLWGLFLSPGKSIFLYSPPLFLAAVGIPQFFRQSRRGFLSLLVMTLPILYIYSRFAFWSGDWAWGPRYLVPFVPLLLVPAAHVLENLGSIVGRVRRAMSVAVVVSVLLAGVFVQVLGCAFYWDHHIRISTETGVNWLGNPDRSGSAAYLPNNCGACFEEMYFQQWLPPFQPIAGHWWLLKHVYPKHTFEQAAADVPWGRYTNLRPFVSTYERARLDWWYRDYHDDFRDVAMRIIFWLSLVEVLGLGLFVWGVVRARRLQ